MIDGTSFIMLEFLEQQQLTHRLLIEHTHAETKRFIDSDGSLPIPIKQCLINTGDNR